MPAEDRAPASPCRPTEKVVKRKESKVTFTADVAGININVPNDDDTEMLGGSVITVTGREVKRYRVPFSKSKPTSGPAELNAQTTSTDQAPEKLPKHKVLTASRKPSLEWRRWLSDELNIFRFGSGSKDVEASKDNSRQAFTVTDVKSEAAREHNIDAAVSDNAVVVGKQQASETISTPPGHAAGCSKSSNMPISASDEVLKTGEERLPHSRHSSRPHIRSRATSRSSSSGYMNERYPMVASAMDIGTAASIAESRRKGPKKAASFAGRTTSSEPAVPEDNVSEHDEAFIEMSEADEKMHAAPAEELPRMTRDGAVDVASDAKASMIRRMPEPRTRSVLELRVKYNAGAGQVSKALEVKKTRQAPASRTALHQDDSHTRIASRSRAEQTIVPQIVPADYAPSSSPPRIPSRLEEDPTLMNISAGPYADDDAADALPSLRRRQMQRMPAPGGVKISDSSSLSTRPQHSTQRQTSPFAAGIAVENNSNTAWLKSDNTPATDNLEVKTALQTKTAAGENKRPVATRSLKQQPKAAMGKLSQEKLFSHHTEDSKDRKASTSDKCTRHRQQTTKTTPHGHA
jgi:hypothetical protein